MTKISKEKQAETLKKMKDNRYQDAIFLRDVIKEKLDWANKERQKGLDAIKSYETEITKLKEQVLRLEGTIIILKQLAEAKKEEKKDKEENEKKGKEC
jgi:hypothetical protein